MSTRDVKPKAGLSFKRHFTSEGTHPFDEVEWETRDALIPNLKEGGNAFEQKDVEFPKTWSQNATNIVAQKYFRGTLGTPQRESSVRQLIGRVVDTIKGWGKKDGYFASDRDADVFSDELTHVLVHQKAAFNSPVWFNVGVPDVTPQCSACQPYDALVSTPSGLIPIGKLVEENAIGAKVFDAEGVTTIVATKANGLKEVLRIRTKAGHQLDVTGDHLVWRASSYEGGAFVRADQLRPGDTLEWHRRYAYGEGEIDPRDMAEAALAGWLQSDGFVGQYRGTNRSLTIEAMTVTGAERAWVTSALDQALPDVHRHERSVETQDPSLDCRRLRLYGAALSPFVERWGLRARGQDMTVPEGLFAAPLPVVRQYLRSIFQAEGYVSDRGRSGRVGMDMISEGIVKGTQQLLARFGIFSRVRFKGDRRPDRKGCWSLSINNVGDQSAFAEEIGFIDPRKAEKLEGMLGRTGRRSLDRKNLEIELIEKLGPMEVYDIQTESGEYLSGNLRVHNCFILAVDDKMTSILNWYVEEGTIFKGGSGSGINLSTLRSSKEHLAGGGTASGPVSFMRGADASAGTIKSGGKTRRAAKMVILNVDHPDVGEFIWCKAVEERKARALRDAGFDMDLDGKDSHSTQYQNANNSVRVTDEFMQAYLDDRDWKLKAVTTGEPVETVRARDLMREIAEAAWECADPGMQYDTIINDWHTCPASGRINASNPCCFVGDALVETADGLVSMEVLEKTASAGHELPLARAADPGTGRSSLRRIRAAWVAGETNRLIQVSTTLGLVLRCTPEHRFLTVDGAYVEARDLAPGVALHAVRGTKQFADEVTLVESVTLDHPVPVYDIEVDGLHNFAVTSDGRQLEHAVIVHNSEYMHLDNSACNLASLNLMKFVDAEGRFDVPAFRHAVEVVFTAQEILVGNSSYPTEKIDRNAKAFRQLGLGYANLGALLMARGLPYDSDEGRAWAGAITALMTGHAYATSARIAERMGPFSGYAPNRDAMLRVMRKHRAAADTIDGDDLPEALLTSARHAWDEAIALGEEHGYRNAQASVLAPTGTIGLMMDCDTTGVEPDLALVKTKKLVGGGTMQIVNQTVPRALEKLGYPDEMQRDIVGYIAEHNSVVGAPHMKEDHHAVFDTAMGAETIHYMGHVKMLAAVQPFISGSISKTINMPEDVTVEDVENLLVEGWRLGLKAVAVYRDNCKVAQPLSADKKAKAVTAVHGGPVRRRLPATRPAHTFSFSVGDADGYITAGEYPDDGIGEIFLKVAKQGSTLAGIMDAFAISVSLGLQYGVPLEAYVQKFTNMRFEPSGITSDPDIRFAASLVDYIFRRLALEYLPPEVRKGLGVQSVEERKESNEHGYAPETTIPLTPVPTEEPTEPVARLKDAPLCFSCGSRMQPAGSCYVCGTCGATSGCS
ncbi:MAG TPA: LAGLIDADG family homing endonuclease [Actinomycetota bacterium]